mmetsp:Transcript_28047/g.56003  ORF Transcript_28047/g.56003 Transcript_28047/m.56003 type:complete len:267 (-) Transcript_28047:493-1293(-)
MNSRVPFTVSVTAKAGEDTRGGRSPGLPVNSTTKPLGVASQAPAPFRVTVTESIVFRDERADWTAEAVASKAMAAVVWSLKVRVKVPEVMEHPTVCFSLTPSVDGSSPNGQRAFSHAWPWYPSTLGSSTYIPEMYVEEGPWRCFSGEKPSQRQLWNMSLSHVSFPFWFGSGFPYAYSFASPLTIASLPSFHSGSHVPLPLQSSSHATLSHAAPVKPGLHWQVPPALSHAPCPEHSLLVRCAWPQPCTASNQLTPYGHVLSEQSAPM